MNNHYFKNIDNFFVAGINYKKSDASVRGLFAIGSEQYMAILEAAAAEGIGELFVLSTCNRTEIYGIAHCPHQLVRLLCAQTAGSAETFLGSAYIKQGTEAVEHTYHVASGLDSQILGDYEIVGQLKTAVRFSKEAGYVGAFTERLINSVLQASKNVKNNTELSGGTVSTAFAAVQYIRAHVPGCCGKKILLVGTGKIGRNTCKNLVDYLGATNITLINRSPEKAQELASELDLRWAPVADLESELRASDVVIVATNARQKTILREHLEGAGDKLIIDLSIPYNVADDAQALPNVRMVNVDELSKLKDETFRMRQAEVPKAKALIAEGMQEFEEWCDMRRHVPLLKDLKEKLRTLREHPECPHMRAQHAKLLDVQIQRVLNETAGRIKERNERGCQYISALHQFISAPN
ncbi:MAG: glutamyl-tRNA reductase [Chitinophagaceae bacterium]|nr:MAG: glutamyl-tRNA reductase [Chitinophagaceae bacterium]